MTVILLSASLQHTTSDHGACTPHCIKPKVTVSHPCQILLNRTLLHKFEKWWCQFSRCVKAKSHKKRPAYTTILVNSGLVNPEDGGTMIPQTAASTSHKTCLQLTLLWEPQILLTNQLHAELQGSQPKYCIQVNCAPSSGAYNTEINGLVKS
jgi:hypothetical protein